MENQLGLMLHSPLPWDVILLIGIQEFGMRGGANFELVTHDNHVSGITSDPVLQRKSMPAFTYIAQLNDGIEDNEELTPGVLKSLLYLLYVVIIRIAGEDRFEVEVLKLVSELELKYREHLNARISA